MERPLRIACQKNGKLTKPTKALLEAAGFQGWMPDSKAYVQGFRHSQTGQIIEVFATRDDDIPPSVADNECDIGIVGLDVAAEFRLANTENFRRLHIIQGFFGALTMPFNFELNCRLALALPAEDAGKDWREVVEGGLVATKYTGLVGRFLAENRVNAGIKKRTGSIEAALGLNSEVKAICDLIVTGGTLAEHSLVEVAAACVLDAKPALIAYAPERPSQASAAAETLIGFLTRSLAVHREKLGVAAYG